MKKIQSIFAIFMLTVLAMAVSSCDPSDPALSGLVGPTWQLDEDQAGLVTEGEVVTYRFYQDGTGVYGFYDYGQWRNMGFTWLSDVSGTNRVQINYDNGQTSYYYYRFDGRNWIISTTRDFYLWELYIPTYY